MIILEESNAHISMDLGSYLLGGTWNKSMLSNNNKNTFVQEVHNPARSGVVKAVW
jgi:hypothetical protein